MTTHRNIAPIIISGTRRYCEKRISQLRSQGWRVVKHRQWSDGRWTFTVEYQQ